MTTETAILRVADNPMEWQARFGVVAKQLHPFQFEFLTRHALIKVACWGRRSGKSVMLGENLVPRWAFRHPDTKVWLTAPTQGQANIVFKHVRSILIGTPLEAFVTKYGDSPWPFIDLWNGTHIEARNLAEGGRNMRGEGGDLLIKDEAAYTTEESNVAITPLMLTSPWHEEIDISTPNGLDHFWKLYMRGESANPEDDDIWSSHMPSWKNPFANRKQLLIEKLQRTDIAWRTEYGAEFVEDLNAPFPISAISKIVDDSILDPEPPILGHQYVIGYDPADVSDRSGLVTLDVTRLPYRAVHVQDIAGMGWVKQSKAVKGESETYFRAPVLMDASKGSVGDPVLQFMREDGVKVYPQQFSNEAKRQMVDGLGILVEQRDIRIPNNRLLRDELKFYRREAHITPRQNTVTYNAVRGEHDDLLTALALACHHARRSRVVTTSPVAMGQTSKWAG